MLLTFSIIFVAVCALVAVARYHEIPASRRPGFVSWVLRKKYRYPLDETAKRFAEQWGKHPTLSKRRAKAIKRSLRKKNRG